MSTPVRDPTDELVVFSVPPRVLHLPADLRDDYCYWPMLSAILLQRPVAPLGPVRDATYQFMSSADDGQRIELRHPCDQCRTAVREAAAVLDHAEHAGLVVCVAQCVVDYLRDLSLLDGRFSPIMRSPGT